MRWVAFLLCLGSAVATGAGEGPDLTEEQQARVTVLVRQLSAEEFAVREEAEKALKDMGPRAYPLFKAALAAAEDSDLRLRLMRVLKALALAAETDPNMLAGFAREEALARRFAEAAQFYARATVFYRQQAQAAKDDEQVRKDLEERLKKNEERRRRASQLAEALAQGGRISIQGNHTYVLIPRDIQGQQSFEYRELPSEAQGDW